MSKPVDPEHPGRFSSSLATGLSMLACFSAEHPTRGIADMAEELELGRSTTHRYAMTLVTLGYLEQAFSRKYRLASAVSNVGLSVLDAMPARRAAHKPLRELRDQTGRTTSLWVLSDDGVRCIDRWSGWRRGQVAVDAGIGLGTCMPVHCTAAGKALLARLPAKERREAIAKLRLVKRCPKTITTKGALRVELERVVAQDGVAVEDEELLAGRRAIAAAIEVGKGGAVAVELAVPASAYTPEQLFEIAPTEAAVQIARELERGRASSDASHGRHTPSTQRSRQRDHMGTG